MISRELLKKYKINHSTFKVIASKQNIDLDPFYNGKKYKYEYRDIFTINIINAHLMGLIWADGSISNTKLLAISLSIDDRQYLLDIQKYLFLNKNVSKLCVTDRSNDDARYSKKNTVVLSIPRTEYVDFLKNSGLPYNKEQNDYTLPKPITEADDSVFLAFLRGFCEGDGSVTQSAKSPRILLSVSKGLGSKLKEQLKGRFGIRSSISKDKSIFRLTIGGTAPVFYLLLKMYSVLPEIIMHRKFIKSKEVWARFLPSYLKEIMPTLELEYVLDSEIHSKVTQLLKNKFSKHDEIISLTNRVSGEDFVGQKNDFIEEYDIKVNMINRVLRHDRISTHNWIMNDYLDANRK